VASNVGLTAAPALTGCGERPHPGSGRLRRT
jgi:hypothetical protein